MLKRLLPTLLAIILLTCTVGVVASAEQIELEVAVFQGGFGLDHFQYVAREYERLHPNVKVNLWGNPRIGVVLRPRFLQGDPPDVVWLVREGVTNAELLRSGLLYPLTEAMNTPAYFQNKTWKETLMPSTLYTLTDGSDNIWGVSLDLLTWNLWYNKEMFEQYGWEPPRTWDEWLKLNDKIKAKGIIPIALQGKISDYNVF
ncbi:MAG: extracellular solute-binding protein, partial [Bacillota bacterium]